MKGKELFIQPTLIVMERHSTIWTPQQFHLTLLTLIYILKHLATNESATVVFLLASLFSELMSLLAHDLQLAEEFYEINLK